MSSSQLLEQIRNAVAAVPNFPKPGILFRDISPLLNQPKLRQAAFDMMAQRWKHENITIVAGMDARGFILATSIADRLNCGMVMLRKPSKLPNTIKVSYSLEYGTNTLEIQRGAIGQGDRVLIVDDLLATGGTAKAACELVEQCGGVVVGVDFLVELLGLNGREKLLPHTRRISSLLEFPSSSTEESVLPKLVEHKLLREHENESDRILVMSHPSMDSITDDIVRKYPSIFERTHVQWNKFPDGTPNIEFGSALEDKKVLFIGSLRHMTNAMEQISLAMVLPRQGIESLDIVFPFYGFGTQDRCDHLGQLACAETVATMLSQCMPLTKTGPATVRIVDIHALQEQFYFKDQIQLKLMTAIPLLISEIEKEYESIRHVTIAFPDDGAAKRFKDAFYNKGFPIVVCSKVRQGDKRVVQIKDRLNWPKSGSEAEKTALENVIIVDDLVQTGGTLNECRKALDSAGFQKVSAFATHAVFPLGAYRKFLKGGQFEGFHRFYVTDSVPETTQLLVHATENKDNNPFKVLSIASLIADDIVGYELLVDTSRQEIHVFVASNKMSKVRAVKRAYDNQYKENYVRIFSANVESEIHAQPVGKEEAEQGATNRIVNLAKVVLANKDCAERIESGEVEAHLIAIENFVDFSDDTDVVMVKDAAVSAFTILQPNWKHSGMEMQTIEEIKNSISDMHVSEEVSMNVPRALIQEVKDSNFSVTVGSLIEEYLGIAQDKWHTVATNGKQSREDILTCLIENTIYDKNASPYSDDDDSSQNTLRGYIKNVLQNYHDRFSNRSSIIRSILGNHAMNDEWY